MTRVVGVPPRRLAFLLLLAAVACPCPPDAHAAPRRPVFEPEDLEMEHPGVIDIDASAGPVRDGQSNRLVAPDFEIDIGLFARTELDIDGTYAFVTPSRAVYRPETTQVDNLWISLKHALWTDRQPGDEHALAVGLQHGLRVPLSRESTGLGYQALGLVGFIAPGRAIVCNVGVFVEPRVVGLSRAGMAWYSVRARPWGGLAGVDFQFDLDAASAWQFSGNVSATGYGLDRTAEIALAAGVTRAWDDAVEVYVQGLFGWLSGGPAVGAIVGVSPKLHLWR